MRAVVAALLATILVVGIASRQPDALAAKQKDTAEGLYVLSAQSGELDRVPGRKGVFNLVVRDPNGDVVSFTDRPQRRAGHLKLARFVRSWKHFGFKKDPPNAALVIADAPNSSNVLVVELINPELRADDSVAFRAKVLKGSAKGALTRFHNRADRRVAADFGEFSLFIDPSELDYFVNFTLKAVPNSFADGGHDGFGIRFTNATVSNVVTLMTTGPAAFSDAKGRGFSITPVGYPGAPGAPIDVNITLSVAPESGESIDGVTQVADGASGTVTVYRNQGGADFEYSEPIIAGRFDHEFSWPLK